jgi:hypothetical protein
MRWQQDIIGSLRIPKLSSRLRIQVCRLTNQLSPKFPKTLALASMLENIFSTKDRRVEAQEQLEIAHWMREHGLFVDESLDPGWFGKSYLCVLASFTYNRNIFHRSDWYGPV